MEYHPLDAAKNEIRLLKIIPVDNDKATSLPGPDAADRPPDTIHCTLEHVSFDDYTEKCIEYSRASGKSVSASRAFWDRNMQRFTDTGVLAEVEGDENTQGHQSGLFYAMKESLASVSEWQRWNWGEYVALSYTWGTWENAQEIVVDGYKVKVTRNLHDFLLTIRRRMTTSCRWGFWIDALCINQGDINERNEQIKRMTVIYQEAFSTILWIGCEADGSSLAMNIVEVIGQGNFGSAQENVEYLEQNGLNDDAPAGLWHTITPLLGRPYWKRLWIIQEIAWSNSTTSVMCGDETVGWAIFGRAITIISSVFRTISAENPGKWSLIANSLPVAAFAQVLLLQHFHMLYSESGIGKPAGAKLLRSVRQAQQTDPKDKVYGILSLLPSIISQAITPNYNLSVQQVFLDFLKSHVLTTKSLDMLRQSPQSQPGEFSEWPSWLLDLREELVGDFDIEHEVPYDVSKGAAMNVSFKDDHCLSAGGIRIDTIDGLGYDVENLFSTKRVIHEDDDTLIFADGRHLIQPTLSQGRNPYHDEEGLRKALWKTLVGDRDNSGDTTPDHYEAILYICIFLPPEQFYIQRNATFAIFNIFRSCNQDFEIGGRPFETYFPLCDTDYEFPAEDEMHKIVERTATLIPSRRLMVTGNGYLGRARNTAKKGDIVAILFGCTVPMILRPFGDKGYKLVGEAYIHGVMEGEAMERLASGDCQVEQFDIY